MAERLAVALVGALGEILQRGPEDIRITSDWLCECHRALAAALFPEWPVLTRLFCDDLAERLRHVRPREEDPGRLAELLAWVDWRFQWIHPIEPTARQRYLAALRAADGGDLAPLTGLWIERLAEAL